MWFRPRGGVHAALRACVVSVCTMGCLVATRAAAYSSGAPVCNYPNAGWADMGGSQAGTGGFLVTVRDGAGVVDRYTPGREYSVEITCPANYKGFLLQSVEGAPGVPGLFGTGVFAWSDSTLYMNGPCQPASATVTHTSLRAGAPRGSDTFQWTAPAAGTGPVTFHLVGVVSRYQWYGRNPIITKLLAEAPTGIAEVSWIRVKQLYR